MLEQPRPGEPVPRPARRSPHLVPLPPPLRRRAPGPAARRAARASSRSCTVGRATGTRRTAIAARRSPTPWPAGTLERAAELIELAAPVMRQARQEATLRRWLEALPDEVFADRPVLAIASGRRADGHRRHHRRRAAARASWKPGWRTSDRPPIVFDDARTSPALPAQVAVYRAGLALLAGDIDGDDRPRQPGARARRARATTSAGQRQPPARARALDRRRPRRGPPPLRRGRARASWRPATSPTCSAARSGWPTSRSPRAGSATPPSTFDRRAATRDRAPRAAGRGRHARRPERGAPRAQRPRRRGATPAGEHRARRARRAPAARLPLARRDRPAPPGPAATSTARSSCSTRPNPLYDTDFSPAVRPGRGAEGPGAARPGRRRRRASVGSRPRPHRRRRAQLRPRVRAHHPRPGARSRVATDRRRRPAVDRRARSGSWSACSPPPRTGGGPGARSRSSCCWRSPDTPATTGRARPTTLARRPVRAPSPRATSGSSSTRARR